MSLGGWMGWRRAAGRPPATRSVRSDGARGLHAPRRLAWGRAVIFNHGGEMSLEYVAVYANEGVRPSEWASGREAEGWSGVAMADHISYARQSWAR
jgi:hypothetical protein